MKSLSLIFYSLFFCMLSIASFAQPPTNCVVDNCNTNTLDLSTGVDQNTGALFPATSPATVQDGFWTLVNAPNDPPVNFGPAWVITPNGAWTTTGTSGWISAFNQSSLNEINPPPNAPYTFERCFCVCDDSELSFNFTAFADDQIADIWLDGNLLIPTPVYDPGPLCNNPAHFTIGVPVNTSAFVEAGEHCLRIDVRNRCSVASGLMVAGSITGANLLTSTCCDNTGSICGFKFNDENQDGVWDTNESALSDWVITATGPDGTQVQTTDQNGNYCFNDLTPGIYTVSEINQPGWTQSFPTGAGTYNIGLAPNQVISGTNFGNYEGGCEMPEPSGFTFHCIEDEGPEGTTFYFHWNYAPNNGEVEPCNFGVGLPIRDQDGNIVGEFENIDLDNTPSEHHFEGIMRLKEGLTPFDVCWSMPFCDVLTGEQCGIQEFCPNPDDPQHDDDVISDCFPPDGPREYCEPLEMNAEVLCSAFGDCDNQTYSISLNISVPAPDGPCPVNPDCNTFTVELTSVTGTIGNLVSVSGISPTSGVINATFGNIAWNDEFNTDFACFQILVKYDDNCCWGDDKLVCFNRFCIDLREYCDETNNDLILGEEDYILLAECLGLEGEALTVYLIEYMSEYCIFDLLRECRNGNDDSGRAGNNSSIESTKNSSDVLSILPNPSRSEAMISYKSNTWVNGSSGSLLITDLTGRIISSFDVDKSEGNIYIPTDDMLSGIYYVVLKTDNQSISIKKWLIIK